jgi:hypothetical protein
MGYGWLQLLVSGAHVSASTILAVDLTMMPGFGARDILRVVLRVLRRFSRQRYLETHFLHFPDACFSAHNAENGASL